MQIEDCVGVGGSCGSGMKSVEGGLRGCGRQLWKWNDCRGRIEWVWEAAVCVGCSSGNGMNSAEGGLNGCIVEMYQMPKKIRDMRMRISVHEDPRKRMHMQISKDGDRECDADANIRARRSADANADPNIGNIIIIYHDFLPTPRRGSHSHV